MPWMPCKDCEHCLYKDYSANEYPCVLCCKGIDKYDMWKSARMKGTTDELFEIVRENYYKANADYIAEQIEIANGVRK